MAVNNFEEDVIYIFNCFNAETSTHKNRLNAIGLCKATTWPRSQDAGLHHIKKNPIFPFSFQKKIYFFLHRKLQSKIL